LSLSGKKDFLAFSDFSSMKKTPVGEAKARRMMQSFIRNCLTEESRQCEPRRITPHIFAPERFWLGETGENKGGKTGLEKNTPGAKPGCD
jgi:hypothetical protein